MTNRVLVLLSGENLTLPEAEARSLLLTYDPDSSFFLPERRVLIADTDADPVAISRRIAFARRVGFLGDQINDLVELMRGRRVRARVYRLTSEPAASYDIENVVRKAGARVDLENPELELSVIQGSKVYFTVAFPGAMRQSWSTRRPRRRPFFHPSAIFPKLSRALVNLARCREGEVLLDPFSGTGSIPIEAFEAGLIPVAADLSWTMARGSLRNMRAIGQEWLGVLRADALHPPLLAADGIATDVPYGRASSRRGSSGEAIVEAAVRLASVLLRPGRFAVVMHESSASVSSTKDIKLVEEHHIYVHRKLTRTISVLRRT